MKILRWDISLPILLSSFTALVVLLTPFPSVSVPEVRRITVDARQFEFAPGRIEVNQGDRIILTLMASDVVHGFYLDGYGIEQRLEPGITRQIEFVADHLGKFRYRCSVSCGTMHPFMIGELVVGPNVPLWRAIGVALVLLVGMLVHLRAAKSIGAVYGTL